MAANSITEVPWCDCDWILLPLGMMPDGVLADDLNPATLTACWQMVAEGFLVLTERIDYLHVFHTTPLGAAVIGRNNAGRH